MKIAIKPMVIGEKTDPEYLEMTLQEFFIDRAHEFEENEKYPFDFTNGGETRWCAVLEGGCQYAFDRDAGSPIRCIDCLSGDCRCPHMNGRYALQRFAKTRVYILDVDLNDTRPRGSGDFSKYHSLTFSEEHELRQMESRLMKVDSVLFFYRTKCNGFRIGFDAGGELTSLEEYEEHATPAEHLVKECTPDRKLERDRERGGAWFYIDRITCRNGHSLRSHAYWSYPRVQHPVWLNPDRDIE